MLILELELLFGLLILNEKSFCQVGLMLCYLLSFVEFDLLRPVNIGVSLAFKLLDTILNQREETLLTDG